MCWICGVAIYLWLGMLMVVSYGVTLKNKSHARKTYFTLCLIWPITVACFLIGFFSKGK